MTKEEAREFLINISYKLGNMAVEYLTEKDGEKMREAIKALEQEPILDKARVEIANIASKLDVENATDEQLGIYKCRNTVLNIIDKYKVESEEV